MKKVMAAALCSAMVIGSLAGCSGNASSGNTPSENVSSESKTAAEQKKQGGDVTWWTWSTEATDAFAKQIEFAKSKNPELNIDIQYTANADYWTKLPVAIAGGTGPDIYQMTRPSFELYAASNQAMDLTEAIENSPILKEYLDSLRPELRDTYKFDGKQMGIPITVESTAIAYNKDIFKAAGLQDLTEIEDSWTWDDLRKIANQLTVKSENGETEQYGFYVPANRIPTWEMIWSHGYEMFDKKGEACTLDQPEIVEALQPLVDMYSVDGVSPSVDVVTTTSGDDMFISGKIAMIPAGIWKVPSYNNITAFEWDVAELPFDASTGKRVSSSNVLGLMVNPNTKNPDAAIALLEQLVQPECQKILADTHTYIPVLESARDSYFEGDVPDNINAFKNALSYVHPNTLTQYIPYAQFSAEYEEALRKAYSGSVTLEESFRALNEKVNAVMEENKAQFE
ncbi:MAG: sugar ABC transporter substrate-binding protein [Lachnospiraceae bacterium]|nr:sugar ABC transporter substrate-binding protein [Lachnospiraceae bacterium]